MSTPPATTPPAHVRTVTLEELAAEVQQLRQRGAEDYAAIRELGGKIDKNHLVMLDSFGELARMLGKVSR